MSLHFLVFLLWGAVASPPQYGNYVPARKFYDLTEVNGDGGQMHVYYPGNATAGEKFPLISYSHGLLGGGIDLYGYTHHLNQLASFGFIVVAPNTCNTGCHDQEKHPWTDCNPDAKAATIPGYRTWFGEQLRAIEWADNHTKNTSDSIFQMLDLKLGVAIAGHSMGGQATAHSAHDNCVKRWNIKVAAVQHGVVGTTNNKIGVPLAGFGGLLDIPISYYTKDQVMQSPTFPKMWRFVAGVSGTHIEPVLEPPLMNPLLATYTVAWLKIHLGQDPTGFWHGLIFDESNSDHICKSQWMVECKVYANASTPPLERPHVPLSPLDPYIVV